MNKLGVTQFLTLMIAVVVILLALALAGPTREFVDDSRNATSGDTLGLGCTALNGTINTSIDNFDRAACVATDMFTPTFIGVLIGLAGAIIFARIIFGG